MQPRTADEAGSEASSSPSLSGPGHSPAQTAQGELPTTATPETSAAGQAVSAAAKEEQAAPQDAVQPAPLQQGQVCEAIVDTVHPDAVRVHLCASQRQGFAPARDLRQLGGEFRVALEPGDRVSVRVLKDPGPPADLVVSLDQEPTRQERSPGQDWARAEELLREKETFEARVTGFNRGGVVVAFGQLEGFVPNSHLLQVGSGDEEVKAKLVGQTISLAVLEIDRANRRLVLSQREAGSHDKEQILSQLQKGQVRTGVVRNLVRFGAFVDLGGVDGLIHISELDWTHVRHPSDVLRVGEEVEVYVLDVDHERSRISLSRKYLLPRPWDKAAPTAHTPEHGAAMFADEWIQHRTS